MDPTTQNPAEHHEHEGPSLMTYMVIFGSLCVFTLISFIANELVRAGVINLFTAVTIIMLVAVVKATLVGMYFMHLKFDWGKLYFLVFPVLILTLMMIIVLLPDLVFGWHNDIYKTE